MATAGLKGNVSLGFVFFFPFSFSWLLGQTLLGGPILKGDVSFQNFFFICGWVGQVGIAAAIVRGIALLESVIHTRFCVLVASCCCFLLLWESHA